MDKSANPLDQLIAMEKRGRLHVVDLATEEDKREYWRAVSFRIADKQFLFDEQGVSELLTLPAITVVPGTKHWVAGIANVRGELLPIVDFGEFLFGEAIKPGKLVRVLVVMCGEVRSGLIVDQVYGMRRFPVDTLKPAQHEELPNTVKGLVTGSYREEQLFHIMDVQRLVDESEFMQTAA